MRETTKRPFIITMLAGLILTACSTADLNALGEGLARGLAEANEEIARSNYYSGPYYNPNGFSSYSGWRGGNSYGDYVGFYQCKSTGSFYICDSNGDGYADMYGDTSTGSYASSNLRVNGRGEAFTWGRNCACWERNRAYDGERKDYHDDYDEYD